MTESRIKVGEPMPPSCPACQAIPINGQCGLPGCPMTNRTNPEQTPDMPEPTDEEIEAVALAMAHDNGAFAPDLKSAKGSLKPDRAQWWVGGGGEYYRRQARAAIRALDEVRRK